MSMPQRKLKLEKYPDGRPFVSTDCSDEIKKNGYLTVQADANEVDINKIVARIARGQGVPMFNGEPFYGDVSELGGLQEAFIKVQEAEDLFMAYPAEVRERFDNDPVKFVEFLEDSRNHSEAVKLGLAERRPENPVSGGLDDKKEGSKTPAAQ